MSDLSILIGAKGGDKLNGESGLEISRNLSNQLANGIKIKVGLADGAASQLQQELDKIGQGLTLKIKNVQVPSNANTSGTPTGGNSGGKSGGTRSSPVSETVGKTMAESFRVANQRAQELRGTTQQIQDALSGLNSAYNQFIYHRSDDTGSAYKKNLHESLTLVNKLIGAEAQLEKRGASYAKTVESAKERFKELLDQYMELLRNGGVSNETAGAMNQLKTVYGQMPASFDAKLSADFESGFNKAAQAVEKCLVSEQKLAAQHKKTVESYMSGTEWDTLSSGYRTAIKSTEDLSVKAKGLDQALLDVATAYSMLEKGRGTDKERELVALYDEEMRKLQALAKESRALSSEAAKQSFTTMSGKEFAALTSGFRTARDEAGRLTTQSAELQGALSKLKSDFDALRNARGSSTESATRTEYEQQLRLVKQLVAEEKKRESANAGMSDAQIRRVNNEYDSLLRKTKQFAQDNQEVTEAVSRLEAAMFSLQNAYNTPDEGSAYATYRAAADNMQAVITKHRDLQVEAAKTASATSQAAAMQASFDTYVNNLNPKAWTEYSDQISRIRLMLEQAQSATGDFAKSFQKQATDAIRQFKSEMKSLGYEGGNIFTYLEGKIKAFTTYFAASKISTGVIGSIGQMKDAVIDLNKAMTDLQIVTGDNNEQARELMQTYNGLAQELGSTTSNVASGAQDWLRQGYSLSETNNLLKQSMALSIMGNMSAEDATTSLTAALKNYRIESSRASEVVDKFFAVDMAAATSSSKLAVALAKCAANAKLAGMSLDDVIGRLASTNEALQESGEETGTYMNTLLSRMGAIKSGRLADPETGEDLSDVETTLRGAGIELRKSETEFRDFGEVLDEVTSKWDNFSDVTKRAIATAFAGTRQQSRFLAMIDTDAAAKQYSEVAANSLGVSAQKMEIYEQGIEAKANRMTAAFEKFSTAVISDDIVGFFYDLGAGVLNAASSFDGWLVKLPILIATFATLKASMAGISTTAFGSSFIKTFKDLAKPKTTGFTRNDVANISEKAA